MDTEKFIADLIKKIARGKLDEKQKQTLHDKVLKLDLEDILGIFPEVFSAGILDKRDGQALFDELLARHDRINLYPLVFECLECKANFLSKTQLENLKEEVINWAPIEIALVMIDMLKNTKLLGREEIEHVAERVLEKEGISCYPMAYYVFEDLDVFELDDLEEMWQKTMAIGKLENCIALAEALKDEDVVTKEDIKSLIEETFSHIEQIEESPTKDLEQEFVVNQQLMLLNAFLDKKMFVPKQIEKIKQNVVCSFAGKDNELEMFNLFANILKKNPFSDDELKKAKKNFFKQIKDAVKTADGVDEIITSSKKAKPLKPDYQNLALPSFCLAFDEGFVIDWKNVFSAQDKKLLRELAIKTQNIDIYEIFVLIWQEKIDELDEVFAELECDCEECK